MTRDGRTGLAPRPLLVGGAAQPGWTRRWSRTARRRAEAAQRMDAAVVANGAAAWGSGAPRKQRPSVVLVEAGTGAPRWHGREAAARQARGLAVALGLAAAAAPLVAVTDLVVALALPVLAHALRQCDSVLADDGAICIAIGACLAAVLIHLAVVAGSFEVRPHALRFAPHVLLVGIGTGALAVSAISDWAPERFTAVLLACLAGFCTFFSPHVTFSVARLLGAGARARWGVALRNVLNGAIVAVMSTSFGALCVFYILLSESISGSVGAAVNGVAYPLIVVLLRKILQVALRHNIDGHVLFAGVLVLIVEIPTSMPQFYVLTAIEGWGAFLLSAFACVVTETLGAVAISQTVQLELNVSRKIGLSLTSQVHPHDMVSSVAEAGDSSANNSTSNSSINNSNKNSGGIKSRAVGETSGANDEALNELAVKLAHEELGERVALLLGCAVGVVLRGFEVAAIANMGVLILLEIASDEVKELVYARRGIHTGRVSFQLHIPTVAAVVLSALASTVTVFTGLRLNCLFSSDVSALVGSG